MPVTLSSVSLDLQHLQPPQELSRCHVPMLDFVPQQLLSPGWQEGHVASRAGGITPMRRRDGGVHSRCVVVECRLTVTRMLFCQENSYHKSECLHVGASAALGSRGLSEGEPKGVGADWMGFVKP